MPVFQEQDIKIFYESYGEGTPLMLLHAGWGAAVNGFEWQIDAFSGEYRIIIPHRRGYGPSSRVQMLEAGYHLQAAHDMLAVMDHAGVQCAHLWGHSDGAVVGAWMAILAPERIRSLVFEGGHLLARKEGERGRAFMQRVREHPESLPESMKDILAKANGEDYWQRILWMWTEAWRLLYERGGDLYDSRLKEIQCPTLVIHGGNDPHTTLDEAGQLAAQISKAMTLFIPQAGHCLHDDINYVDRVHKAVTELLDSVDKQEFRHRSTILLTALNGQDEQFANLNT